MTKINYDVNIANDNYIINYRTDINNKPQK